MPSILKIRITCARDLPVMDRTSELTDAYVELRFADFEPQRTHVCRKTLNPVWNSDFRFEVSDDSELQNEHLELKVLDYDAITTNDAVGTIYIDLNPMISSQAPQISGWFPIYDTIRGVRGELNVSVKLQFFGDINPLRESSLSVKFFSTPSTPIGYKLDGIIGLVDYLVTEQDPEYHWSDNFRSPRSSNEARQRVLASLNGELRKNVAKKILEMGGNSVVGYQLYYDFEEEERCITARCIGTACKISLIDYHAISEGFSGLGLTSPSTMTPRYTSNTDFSASITKPALALSTISDSKKSSNNRLSWDDQLQIALTKDINLDQSNNEESNDPAEEQGSNAKKDDNASELKQKLGFRTPELLFMTIQKFPPGVVVSLGGIVSSHSVKLLSNEDKDPDIRDSWWMELRNEIKSHARALGCPHVIGYVETCAIQEDMFLLSATGTAAILDLVALTTGGHALNAVIDSQCLPSPAYQKLTLDEAKMNIISVKRSYPTEPLSEHSRARKKKSSKMGCHITHVPYSYKRAPLPMNFSICSICHKKHVPEVLFSTTSPPEDLATCGSGILINALVCRSKKKQDGELNAAAIGDSVPFLEYDIHRQLMYKLRVLGYNSIFGLVLNISVGEMLITASASGTAFMLPSLPIPPSIQISRNIQVIDEEDKNLLALQSEITEESEKNRKFIEELLEQSVRSAVAGDATVVMNNKSNPNPNPNDGNESTGGNVGFGVDVEESESDDDSSESSLSGDEDYKAKVVLQVDDDADEDVIAVLLEPPLLEGFQLCNVETIPKAWMDSNSDRLVSQQNIVLIKTGQIESAHHHPNRQLVSIFHDLLYDLMYSALHFQIGLISVMNYEIQLPRENEIRIVLNASIMGFIDVPRPLIASATGSEIFDVGIGGVGGKNTSYSSHDRLMLQENPINGARVPPTMSGTSHRAAGMLEGISSYNGSIQEIIVEAVENNTLDENSSSVVVGSGVFERPNSMGAKSTIDEEVIVVNNSSSNNNNNNNNNNNKEDSMSGSGDSVGADEDEDISDETRNPITSITGYNSSEIRADATTATRSSTSRRTRATSSAVLEHSGDPTIMEAAAAVNPSHLITNSQAFPPSLMMSNYHIEITPLPFVAGGKVENHLGHISLNFVKEDTAINEFAGGVSSFINSFILEVQAVVRAHVIALGGNALVSFKMNRNIIEEHVKNRGYGLLAVTGDVITVSYESEYLNSWYSMARQYCRDFP